MGDDPEKSKAGMKNLKAPSMNFSQTWSYISNLRALSPIPKDLKFGQTPEGVLRLGATFGIDGNNIVYKYEDGIPGDHPVPKDVIEAILKPKKG
jgi:hypothetical protein